ncbi:MAG TPA: helix-turn-helix transcriptional regulator [Syntrophobacteraceae bacterium]|nr:helix-turn-helix transcriptional regulator [Syntrophobacteraceae bacterium]
MSALTKRRPIENVREVKFRGPSDKIRQLTDFAKYLGLIDTSEGVTEDFLTWRETLPEITNENMPGICLRGARYKEGITQRQLSEVTGIPQRHISEMENAKRPIGKKNAKLFAKVLGTGYKLFL